MLRWAGISRGKGLNLPGLEGLSELCISILSLGRASTESLTAIKSCFLA